jgi:hypothetical protein
MLGFFRMSFFPFSHGGRVLNFPVILALFRHGILFWLLRVLEKPTVVPPNWWITSGRNWQRWAQCTARLSHTFEVAVSSETPRGAVRVDPEVKGAAHSAAVDIAGVCGQSIQVSA